MTLAAIPPTTYCHYCSIHSHMCGQCQVRFIQNCTLLCVCVLLPILNCTHPTTRAYYADVRTCEICFNYCYQLIGLFAICNNYPCTMQHAMLLLRTAQYDRTQASVCVCVNEPGKHASQFIHKSLTLHRIQNQLTRCVYREESATHICWPQASFQCTRRFTHMCMISCIPTFRFKKVCYKLQCNWTRFFCSALTFNRNSDYIFLHLEQI